jgi:hypothetical protein
VTKAANQAATHGIKAIGAPGSTKREEMLALQQIEHDMENAGHGPTVAA